MLVVGMGAAAASTQAVERGDSERRGEVAVAAAAGRALGQLLADRSRPIRRACSNRPAIAGDRSIGGRLKPPETSSRVPSVIGSSDRSDDSTRRGFIQGRDPDVDIGRCLRRDDVRGRPAPDDADVERRPGAVVLQLLDAQDLMRQLDDRAAALPRGHSGMSGLPWTSRLNRPTPLRAVFRLPSASGRLEYQHVGALSCQVFDQAAGCRAADLLVRGEQRPDRRGVGRSGGGSNFPLAMQNRKIARPAFMS